MLNIEFSEFRALWTILTETIFNPVSGRGIQGVLSHLLGILPDCIAPDVVAYGRHWRAASHRRLQPYPHLRRSHCQQQGWAHLCRYKKARLFLVDERKTKLSFGLTCMFKLKVAQKCSSAEKCKILITFQKLPKNGQFGPKIVPSGFKKLPNLFTLLFLPYPPTYQLTRLLDTQRLDATASM